MAKSSIFGPARRNLAYSKYPLKTPHLVIVEELGKSLGEDAIGIAGGIFSGMTPLKEPKIS
jgi:hypothetical protein